jgi:hypothetical protein
VGRGEIQGAVIPSAQIADKENRQASVTPPDTRKSICECNAISGDQAAPDMVTFLGSERSQGDTDPKKRYGHKNVIFLDTEDDNVPSRAIAAPRELLASAPMGRVSQLMMSLMDFENREFYGSIRPYYDEVADTPVCESGVYTRDLPTDCREIANDPRVLFAKLDQWGCDSIVIPHGNSWGMNTPASSSFDKQLSRAQHDPDRQILFEVYSGHGNSEEYRAWRASVKNAQGDLSCPAPSDGYLPSCWRAGEIIRRRCDAAGIDDAECLSRESNARQNFVDAGNSGHLTIPGQHVTDWLNCGTCPDCFNDPMDHRPGTTAQYALAITDFEQPDDPLRFRFGMIGSSDNHRGQAGTGYKEVNRKHLTEAFGSDNPRMADRVGGDDRGPVPRSVPRFSVGAVGAFKQLPGCPDFAHKGLGSQRLELLCGGECYNPGDERHLIERIEVVRIRPQVSADEKVDNLIEDPWRIFNVNPIKVAVSSSLKIWILTRGSGSLSIMLERSRKRPIWLMATTCAANTMNKATV